MTGESVESHSAALVTFAIITLISVAAQLFAVVISCGAFVLIWRDKTEFIWHFTENRPIDSSAISLRIFGKIRKSLQCVIYQIHLSYLHITTAKILVRVCRWMSRSTIFVLVFLRHFKFCEKFTCYSKNYLNKRQFLCHSIERKMFTVPPSHLASLCYFTVVLFT